MNQTEIDFTHGLENNMESQFNYKLNLDHFNNQCRIVLEQLLTGRKLNVRDAFINLGIGHLPRRIKDLREAGIPVCDEFPLDEKTGKKERFKKYWLERKVIDAILGSTEQNR